MPLENNFRRDLLISVIVAVYNVEKYIQRCLDSIINQTYSNLEIILIDDGSTDTSGKICDEYAKKYKHVKIIHKKNGGLVSARNEGLHIATGDYIGFIDGDDWIEPQTYQVAIELLEKNQVDMVKWGKTKVINNNIKPVKTYYKSGIYKNERKTALLVDIIKGNGIDQNIVSCLFKKKIINDNYIQAPLGLDQGEDLYFITSYLLQAKSIYVDLNLHLYNYRQNPTSLTKYYSSTYMLKIARFIEIYGKFINSLQNSDLYKHSFYYRLNSIIFYILFVCADFNLLKISDKVKVLSTFYLRFESEFMISQKYNHISIVKRIPVILFYKKCFYISLFISYLLKIAFKCKNKIKFYA